MTDALFRALLWLLPSWFRSEFAPEMRATFQADLASARRAGMSATGMIWMRTVRDVSRLALRLHAETLAQDVAYAVRTLGRTPTFTLAAIVTLVVGLAPTVVVANLIHQVAVAPLPFPEADRLMALWNANPERGRREVPLSLADFVDYRERQRTFAAMAAHTATSIALSGAGEPQQIGGVLATSDLDEVLGVRPRLGRLLEPADSGVGAVPVVVLGARLWRTQFGERMNVIGEQVVLDGTSTTIVGVLPEGLDFPSGSEQAWLPLRIDPSQFSRGGHFLSATGRLLPGTPVERAAEDLNTIARSLEERYPTTNAGQGIELVDLKRQINGDAPRLVAVLAGAIAAVLLIACTNVASLLTIRTSARSVELAVRSALGATAPRLGRQLLVEHVVLALAGGLLASGVGWALHGALVSSRVLALPRGAARFEWPALGILFLLAIGIAGAFAWLTAHRSSRTPQALVSSARQSDGPRLARARQALIGAEVALALGLLVVTGLMIQSAARLARVDPGFRTDGVLTFGVVLPAPQYAAASARVRFVTLVTEGLRALPGVRSASAAAYAPMGSMRSSRRFAVVDRPEPAAGNEPVAIEVPVGTDYFAVMGVPILEGRVFDDHDSAEALPVLIVSESFARQVFPGERAVGRRVRFFSGRPGAAPPPPREIVGIVADVRQESVAGAPLPQMYMPYGQSSWSFASFFIQTELPSSVTTRDVQGVVGRIDPQRPIRDVLSIRDIVQRSTTRQRAMTRLLAGLALAALLLAAVGLYGVSATAAAARSRELAIRAAIGARRAALLRLVVGGSLVSAGLGVVLGGAAGLAAARGLGSLLYEVEIVDPTIIASTALLLLGVTALAAWLPARRALSRNPSEVLRAE